MTRLHSVIWAAALALLTVWPGSSVVLAQETPDGPVILEVTGAIAGGNAPLNFDRSALIALGTVDLVTDTPWTDAPVRFTGVLARKLMERIGAAGSKVRAVALNDYTVEIPIEDFEDYDVLLALDADGKPMRVRDRGPIWVVYPWADRGELRTDLYYTRSIWQLKSLTVLE